MDEQENNLITWSKIFAFLQIIVLGLAFFWIFKFETGILVRIVLICLTLGGLIAAIFSRPYLLLLILVLLGTALGFNILSSASFIEPSFLLVFLVMVAFLTDVVAFGYLIGKLDLKSNLGKAAVLGTVVCLSEIFWLFTYLAANPLIRSAILVLVFHLFVGLLPHSLQSKLVVVSLRQYLVVAIILLVILVQFL